jgi:ATP-dependent DNA ligase
LSDAVDSGDEHDDDNADNGRDQLLDELHADPAEARPVDVGIQLCYVAFDCLWLNGKSLMSQPLTERRAALSNAIRVGSKRLQIVSNHFDLNSVLKKSNSH